MLEAASSSVNIPDVVDVNVESQQSVVNKRKLTSLVWSDFKRIPEPDGKIFAVCNHCKKKFSGESRHGTTHLKNHVNRCLVRLNKLKGQLELQAVVQDAENTTFKIQNFKFDQDRSRMDLAKMVIKHHYPFKIVEHELFSVFVSNLQPRFRMHSRNTLRSDVMKVYDFERKKMYTLLEDTPGRVSLTTDLWTCTSQKVAYCSLTVHFIDKEWILRKKIIAFPNVESRHDGVSLFEIMKTLLLEWNIEKKVFSLTVDNASSNDVMTRHLKNWLNSLNMLPMNGDIFHVRCAAHIMNLIVQDGLKSIEGMLTKVRESVIYVNSSPQRKHQFGVVLSQLKLHKLPLPGDDVPTRWNSTYLMLKAAISIKEAYARLSHVDSRYILNPSTEEWEVGQSICECLSVFYDATVKLSGVKYPTANIYFPIVCGVQDALFKWADHDFAFVSDMSLAMKAKFDKYWKESNLLMSLGIILDPRFKLAFVQYYLNELYGIGSELQLSHVRTALKMMFDEYNVDNGTENSVNSNINSNVIVSHDVNVDCLKSFNDWYNVSQNICNSTPPKSELERYLEDALVPGDNFNILTWWAENFPRYPTLGKMARDVLAVPISTVASESAFSIGGNIIDSGRHLLGADVVQALMCAQDWIESANGKVSRRSSSASGAPLHP